MASSGKHLPPAPGTDSPEGQCLPGGHPGAVPADLQTQSACRRTGLRHRSRPGAPGPAGVPGPGAECLPGVRTQWSADCGRQSPAAKDPRSESSFPSRDHPPMSAGSRGVVEPAPGTDSAGATGAFQSSDLPARQKQPALDLLPVSAGASGGMRSSRMSRHEHRRRRDLPAFSGSATISRTAPILALPAPTAKQEANPTAERSAGGPGTEPPGPAFKKIQRPPAGPGSRVARGPDLRAASGPVSAGSARGNHSPGAPAHKPPERHPLCPAIPEVEPRHPKDSDSPASGSRRAWRPGKATGAGSTGQPPWRTWSRPPQFPAPPLPQPRPAAGSAALPGTTGSRNRRSCPASLFRRMG